MQIKKIIIFSFTLMSQDMICFSLMLDPAGDAKYTGRSIGNTFERSITMQMAQQLKEQLEEKYRHVNVTLTRTPGETLYPLQNANFANRLPADLYVNLSCYKDNASKPTIYIYRYSNQFAFLPAPSITTFIAYHHAFLINASMSNALAQIMMKELSSYSFFTTKGIYAFPLKPLIGITAPAFAIECGINKQDQWQEYIPALFASISTVIEKCAHQEST